MCDLPPLFPEHMCGWYPFSGLTFPSWHEVETCAIPYHTTVLISAVFILAICRYTECTESRSLSDERSVASSKANSERLRSSASSSKCQYLFLALRSCSSRYVFFLVFSALLFFFTDVFSQRAVPRMMWPILLFFFLLYVECTAPLWLTVTLPYFSHDRSNWSSPSFSSTTQSYAPNVALYWFLP